MAKSLILFLVLLAALNLIIGVKYKQLVEILPSLSWITLSIIPFLYSQKFFPEATIFDQTIGVVVIGIALSFGDLYSMLFPKSTQVPYYINNKIKYKVFLYALVCLVLLIPVTHLYFSGSMPLINKIFGNSTSMETAINREVYMKISLPYWFKIISNWSITIIGPTLVAILFYRKRFWQAILIFAWVLFYAYSSTQQGPSVFLIISITIILTQFRKNTFRNFVSAAFIVIFGTTVIVGTYYGNTIIERSQNCPIPPGVQLTPGNIVRSCPIDNLKTINPIVERIGYRIFLAPVEVSNYWYQYFDNVNHKKRSISELLNRNPKSQASNEVGIWAFQKNFPNHYLPTVNAYSSIDADAYSFGGLPAIFLVSLVLLLIRIYISRSKYNNNLHEKILNGLGITFLTLFPFSASLQAMLIPQGLLVVLLAIYLIRNKEIFAKKLYK